MGFTSVKISTEKLRAAIDRSDKSIAMLAREMGIPAPGTITNWMLRGKVAGVRTEYFAKLVAALGVKPEDLKIAAPETATPADSSGIDPNPVKTPITPTWDFDLRASVWTQAPICELDYDDPQQRCVIDTGRFRLRIQGTCMEPAYASGSVIEFEVIRWDRHSLLIGADYVICKSDGLATFKQLREIEDDELIFSARNQKEYPGAIVVPRQEIARMAKVAHRLADAASPTLPKLRVSR